MSTEPGRALHIRFYWFIHENAFYENDELIRHWYGPLSRQVVAADLQAFLDGEL